METVPVPGVKRWMHGGMHPSIIHGGDDLTVKGMSLKFYPEDPLWQIGMEASWRALRKQGASSDLVYILVISHRYPRPRCWGQIACVQIQRLSNCVVLGRFPSVFLTVKWV